MRILTIISGEYGLRHLSNLQARQPGGWSFEVWKAPSVLPLIIDYPEEFLPESFPESDLILSFAENKSVAELLPDIAKMCHARAVIVAVDNENWLPRGLGRQLKGWLASINVACACPKPLCSLTEKDYKITRRERVTYESDVISEFAHFFGQPDIQITIDPITRNITSAQVIRDAVCGCANFVANKLVGLTSDEAEEKAGLAHHHFPCLASMVKLDDYNHDTLMHESGHLLQDNLAAQLKSYKQIKSITPGNKTG